MFLRRLVSCARPGDDINGDINSRTISLDVSFIIISRKGERGRVKLRAEVVREISPVISKIDRPLSVD